MTEDQLQALMFFAAVFAGLSIIFFGAVQLSKRKARPDSTMCDKYNRHWHYYMKTKSGYLFQNPEGLMQTLNKKELRIFNGYRF